jgi:hypothetical protein
MSVGIQPNSSQLDTQMTQLANSLRKIMGQLRDFCTENNVALATLETAGYDAADAALFQLLLGYYSTLVGIYYGNVQQGGSGGDGAITFDFDNALSQLWGGQVQ